MYLSDHARANPNKLAMVTTGGQAVSYGELEERSRRLARLLYARGLRRGDHISIFMENNIRYMDVVWAAYRSGLYVTPINRFSNTEEAAYIAQDCGAKAIISSSALRVVAEAMPRHLPNCKIRLAVDGVGDGQAHAADVGSFVSDQT